MREINQGLLHSVQELLHTGLTKVLSKSLKMLANSFSHSKKRDSPADNEQEAFLRREYLKVEDLCPLTVYMVEWDMPCLLRDHRRLQLDDPNLAQYCTSIESCSFKPAITS